MGDHISDHPNTGSEWASSTQITGFYTGTCCLKKTKQNKTNPQTFPTKAKQLECERQLDKLSFDGFYFPEGSKTAAYEEICQESVKVLFPSVQFCFVFF